MRDTTTFIIYKNNFIEKCKSLIICQKNMIAMRFQGRHTREIRKYKFLEV